MNTLEMAGFSTEKYWIFSFQKSSGYTNSTENTEKVLSEKTMDFDEFSWQKCHKQDKQRLIITSIQISNLNFWK